MALDVKAANDRIVGQLRSAPKVASPADLQSYVGSPVPVLGLSVPTMRAIIAAFAKDHTRMTAAELNALAAALWSGALFEEKSLAIFLLERYEKILDDDSWTLVDGWVDVATGWALSDTLASGDGLARRTSGGDVPRRMVSSDSSGRANSTSRSDSWRDCCTMRSSGCNVPSAPGCASAGRKIADGRRVFCDTTWRVCPL